MGLVALSAAHARLEASPQDMEQYPLISAHGVKQVHTKVGQAPQHALSVTVECMGQVQWAPARMSVCSVQLASIREAYVARQIHSFRVLMVLLRDFAMATMKTLCG